MCICEFDTVINRNGTDSLKWSKYKNTDIIPMWIADMDFPCALEIKQALHKHIEHGIFGYSVPSEELSAVTSEWLRSRYSWNIEKSWLVWLPGLVPALNLVCRTFAAPGDEVITFTPVYPPFLSAPGHSGRKLVISPLKRENNSYAFDLADLRSKITPRTKAVILCSPHNPVGRAYSADELKAVADICLENNIMVCSDEIHCDLLHDGRKHLPTAMLSGRIAENTVTLMAPSKTFNLPGLGCSFAVIPNCKVREKFTDAAEGLLPGVNAVGFTACLAAYRNCEYWRQNLLAYLGKNRDMVYDYVNNRIPALAMDLPQATYLAWIDARKLNIPDAAAFFEKAGVGLHDGKFYGGQGFLRLNFGCPRSTLLCALQRMERAVKNHLAES